MHMISESFENKQENKVDKLDEKPFENLLEHVYEEYDQIYKKRDVFTDKFDEKLSISNKTILDESANNKSFNETDNKTLDESDDKSDKNESIASSQDRERPQQVHLQQQNKMPLIHEAFIPNYEKCFKCNKNFVGKYLLDEIKEIYDDYNKKMEVNMKARVYERDHLFFIRDIVEVGYFYVIFSNFFLEYC